MKAFHMNSSKWCIRILIWTTVLLCTLLTTARAFSIKPPSEEIYSNQLCPNPTIKAKQVPVPIESIRGDKKSNDLQLTPQSSKMPEWVMAINLDKPQDSTHFYESCTFKEVTLNRPRGIRVRSTNLNINSWNFSQSTECESFIKFNHWDEHDGGRYPVLCGRDNFDQFLGPYGHPMILFYQWKNGGLSFPLFHSSFRDQHRDRKETLELNYMQIYFHVTTGGNKGQQPEKKCRVQQYRLDWLRLGCGALTPDSEPICGEYNCDELEELYKAKMTIFKDGESENDTVLVWKPKQDKYKMRTFLRQKFVPVVFLIVLIFAYRSYMKAGLRYNSAMHEDILDIPVSSFRLRRHVPAASSNPGTGNRVDPYWEGLGRRLPSRESLDSPNGVILLPPKDPPPSYDESVCVLPPTYSEATNKPLQG